MKKLIDIQERHQLITEELAQDETIELINKTIAGYCEGSILLANQEEFAHFESCMKESVVPNPIMQKAITRLSKMKRR